MPQLQPDLFFNLGHLFEGTPGPASFLYYIYGVLFLAVLCGGIYGYIVVRPNAAHKVRKQYAEFFSLMAIGLGVVGLILVGLRFAEVPLISARIITYVWLVASVLFAIYAGFFFIRMLPQRIKRYEAATLRLQTMPRAKLTKSSKKGHKR